MRLLLALSAAAALFACAVPPSSTGVPEGELSVDEEESSEEAAASGYFLARRDFRRCAFPFCGGFWVHRANQAETVCPGGAGSAAECYVVEIDASSIGNDINVDQFDLVRGRFSTRRINGSRVAVLNASEVWTAATDAAATGSFYTVESNGLTCITTPCFSTEATRLNSNARPTALSEIDLSAIGCSGDQEQAALAAIADGALIAAGVTASVPKAGPAGRGRVLRASQIYFRYEHDPNACSSDAQCGWSSHVRPVASSADCYCPGCPVPMAEALSEQNRESWDRFCDHIRCEGPRCAPLTGAICEPQGAQGVCGQE